MSSEQKTSTLGLSKYQGDEHLLREDFNSDLEKIDMAISEMSNPVETTINDNTISFNTNSNLKKVTLKISADVTGGPILVSRNGQTAKPLKLPNDEAVTELLAETMFYDVVEESEAFIYAPKNGATNYFGTGEDGDVTISSTTYLPVDTQYRDAIVKNYRNLIIEDGVVLSVDSQCEGLIIYATDSIIINGTISMSEKSHYTSSGSKPPVFLGPKNKAISEAISKLRGGRGGNGGAGGAGGAGGYGSLYGRTWAGGFGGGGGAAGTADGSSASGGSIGNINITTPRGTQFPSGALMSNSTGFAISGLPGQGGGGKAAYISSYGGGSNGAGGGGASISNSSAFAGGGHTGRYAGGCIILIAPRIEIKSTGFIKANGGQGGQGGRGSQSNSPGGGGGGGAGGGVVAIIYSIEYSNKGSITVNGGQGGANGGVDLNPGVPGTAGGIGTIYVKKV